jgi:hypothetical protein
MFALETRTRTRFSHWTTCRFSLVGRNDVFQTNKATRCHPDVWNPVWRTSDSNAIIWPLFARLIRERFHIILKRTITRRIIVRFRTTDWLGCLSARQLSRQVRKHVVLLSARTLRDYHWLSQIVELSVKRGSAWHAWQTHTFRTTTRSTLHQPPLSVPAKRNYH